MNRVAARLGQLAVCSAVLAVPLLGSAFYTELATKALVLSIFAMSLDLLVGFSGLVSFGHAAYFGVAAYALALLTPRLEGASLWIALPASIGAAGLAALAIGFFALRTRGVYFIMVTLAFAQMVYYVFHDTGIGGGSDGIYVNFRPDASLFGFKPFDLGNARHLYYFVAALALATYLLLARTLRSAFGCALMGIRSNEHRMQSLGYRTFHYKLAAFTLAGGLAGLAGFLYAVLYGFVTPELMAWHQSGDVLLMVILGGIGTLTGPVMGALALVGLHEAFSSLTRHWQLAMGTVIVLAVIALPGGLARLPARVGHALAGIRNRNG
ncbi:MAG TPA: branched-chain amino acid ABC transporter permease [Burkholderiaceae bacterium]